ncbi:hypothetical protein BJ684DRAFT_20406 [Piptocephalis cylindrospora]|uniref:Uncharacterized protein n=1 Tax=Piptocephalis cylindrospora TaxID=1907219 RepID=A0A4P9Y2G4_9FUNG|nr:hypothetical protein BJ684DRAFT_20406 [Piptocephalis cylindrospora]|eukprot:RKP13086.1 hypothetical protein BJ684DRAFT_20406 [Piptocephalis cylindrospora]
MPEEDEAGYNFVLDLAVTDAFNLLIVLKHGKTNIRWWKEFLGTSSESFRGLCHCGRTQLDGSGAFTQVVRSSFTLSRPDVSQRAQGHRTLATVKLAKRRVVIYPLLPLVVHGGVLGVCALILCDPSVHRVRHKVKTELINRYVIQYESSAMYIASPNSTLQTALAVSGARVYHQYDHTIILDRNGNGRYLFNLITILNSISIGVTGSFLLALTALAVWRRSSVNYPSIRLIYASALSLLGFAIVMLILTHESPPFTGIAFLRWLFIAFALLPLSFLCCSGINFFFVLTHSHLRNMSWVQELILFYMLPITFCFLLPAFPLIFGYFSLNNQGNFPWILPIGPNSSGWMWATYAAPSILFTSIAAILGMILYTKLNSMERMIRRAQRQQQISADQEGSHPQGLWHTPSRGSRHATYLATPNPFQTSHPASTSSAYPTVVMAKRRARRMSTRLNGGRYSDERRASEIIRLVAQNPVLMAISHGHNQDKSPVYNKRKGLFKRMGQRWKLAFGGEQKQREAEEGRARMGSTDEGSSISSCGSSECFCRLRTPPGSSRLGSDEPAVSPSPAGSSMRRTSSIPVRSRSSCSSYTAIIPTAMSAAIPNTGDVAVHTITLAKRRVMVYPILPLLIHLLNIIFVAHSSSTNWVVLPLAYVAYTFLCLQGVFAPIVWWTLDPAVNRIKATAKLELIHRFLVQYEEAQMIQMDLRKLYHFHRLAAVIHWILLFMYPQEPATIRKRSCPSITADLAANLTDSLAIPPGAYGGAGGVNQGRRVSSDILDRLPLRI